MLAGPGPPSETASLGLVRARRERWTDPERLVARLRAGRETFGQDWCVVRAPVSAVPEIGRHVRPRVQLDRLPEGLEERWSRA